MRLVLAIVLMLTGPNVSAEPDNPQEMMELLAQCLLENAPDNWQAVSINYKKLGQNKDGLNQVNVSHNVIVGAPDSLPQKLEPCRPLIPAQLIQMLSKTLPQESQHWKEVTISIDKAGKVKTTYVQP